MPEIALYRGTLVERGVFRMSPVVPTENNQRCLRTWRTIRSLGRLAARRWMCPPNFSACRRNRSPPVRNPGRSRSLDRGESPETGTVRRSACTRREPRRIPSIWNNRPMREILLGSFTGGCLRVMRLRRQFCSARIRKHCWHNFECNTCVHETRRIRGCPCTFATFAS